MKRSVFTALAVYVRDVFRGARSIAGSCMAAFPYLLRWGELRKEVTEGYPDPISSKTADDLPTRSRGLLFNDIDRCTGCKECSKVCPAQCIRVEETPSADPSKSWVSVYDVDFSRCIFCGLCVEACPTGSLVHTKQYEGAAYQVSDLLASFGRGQLSAEHRAKWAFLGKPGEKEEASP